MRLPRERIHSGIQGLRVDRVKGQVHVRRQLVVLRALSLLLSVPALLVSLLLDWLHVSQEFGVVEVSLRHWLDHFFAILVKVSGLLVDVGHELAPVLAGAVLLGGLEALEVHGVSHWSLATLRHHEVIVEEVVHLGGSHS